MNEHATAPLRAGEITTLAVGIRRVLAPNPGMMTGPGTNTYLIGNEEVAIIDPGPAIQEHLDLLAKVDNIKWILATHTHPDHSPGVARLAAMTGAKVYGIAAPNGPHQDKTFSPDIAPIDGDVLHGADFRLRMLHTPGHASNHLCFLHEGHRWLFTGDHIMNGSTVVIDPPDGDMRDYLASLQALLKVQLSAIAPGHGDVFDNPYEVIEWIIEHRLTREAKVVAALSAHPDTTSQELVMYVYDDVSVELHSWAERSLLAHLTKLQKDDRVSRSNSARWRLQGA